MRLDTETAARFSLSRTQAAKMIAAGNVSVGGKVVTKPGAEVSESDEILLSAAEKFVGRGGYKLEAALDRFGIPVDGMTAVDIGASTGGFTDCLLQRGAGKVYAVDVGSGQLAPVLRADPRVVVIENFNARSLSADDLGEKCDIAVTDVSFISQRLLYPAIVSTVRPGGTVVTLIKPQFEAGRAAIGKGGIVRDRAAHERVIGELFSAALENGLTPVGLTASPIPGGDGNREYLLYLRCGADAENSIAGDGGLIRRTVAENFERSE